MCLCVRVPLGARDKTKKKIMIIDNYKGINMIIDPYLDWRRANKK